MRQLSLTHTFSSPLLLPHESNDKSIASCCCCRRRLSFPLFHFLISERRWCVVLCTTCCWFIIIFLFDRISFFLLTMTFSILCVSPEEIRSCPEEKENRLCFLGDDCFFLPLLQSSSSEKREREKASYSFEWWRRNRINSPKREKESFPWHNKAQTHRRTHCPKPVKQLYYYLVFPRKGK